MTSRVLACFALCLSFGVTAHADLFLVKTTEGPGFADPSEVLEVLENGIIPTFEALAELKAKKKILAIGLPAGSRTFYMFVEAANHDEVDRMLRDLPAWGVFSWKVVPMQTLEGRTAIEREIVRDLKAAK